ncbi:MAG: UbiA family prenyltransferase [Thermomicrobiales bacterium]
MRIVEGDLQGREEVAIAPRIATLLAWLRLPHFVPIAAVLSATAGLAWVISGQNMTASRLSLLLLAMLGGQIVVGVVNEIVDAPIDARVKPDKPLPAGLVSTRGAAGMGLAGFLLMAIAGAALGWKSLALLTLGTGIGVAYSLWFKGTQLAWLPYLVALPLLPVWVAVSFGAFETELLALYVIGIPATFAIHLAQSVPDVEADRSAGLRMISTRLGERGSLIACWGSLLATVVVAAASGYGANDIGGWLVASVLIGLAAIGVNWLIWRRSSRAGIMAAFPCTAIAVGALALAWVASIYS